MSLNIKQIYDQRSTTSFQNTDLLYLGRSPFSATSDYGFTYASLAAQFAPASITGTVTSITAGSNLTGGTITSSGTIALSSTVSGLTSLGVGNLSFNGTFVLGTTGVTVAGVNSGSAVVLSPNNGFVAITDFGNSNPQPLRFYNSNATHYVGFQAGTLSADTTWTWPTTDSTGTQALVSNGSGTLSWSSVGSGSVTSITAGTNLTGGTITTSGTIALSSTPTGLTSINAGGVTLINNSIASAGLSLSISGSPGVGGILNIVNGNDVGRVRLFNNIGNFYVGIRAGALSASVEYILPSTDAANGLLQSDGAGNWSLTATPAGLTSLNVAPTLGAGSGINILADTINNISLNDFTIYAESGKNLNLSATLSGAVQIKDPTSTVAVPLRFYNSTGSNYVGFKAGTLSTNTSFILPTSDGGAGQSILTDGSANLSFGMGYTPSYINGCGIVYASSSTLSVRSGTAVDGTGAVLITSAGYTLDFSGTGANKLDTGSVASNSLYAIYIIRKNDGTTASLASLSFSSPTLPSGYTRFRRIGTWQTITSANLAQFIQRGSSNNRYYELTGARAAAGSGGFIFVNGGNATTTTTINLSSYIPSSVTEVNLQLTFNALVATHDLDVKNSDASTYVQLIQPGVTAVNVSQGRLLTLSTTQTFDYKVANAGDTAYVELIGYSEEV